MPLVELTAPGFSIELTYDGPTVDFGDTWFGAMVRALASAHKSVPLTQILFYQDAVTPTMHHYEIDAADGRQWRQELHFASQTDNDPGMTFDVTDHWKLSEFALQRAVRDALIVAYNLSACRRLEVVWS